jgi:hypothetical protein
VSLSSTLVARAGSIYTIITLRDINPFSLLGFVAFVRVIEVGDYNCRSIGSLSLTLHHPN